MNNITERCHVQHSRIEQNNWHVASQDKKKYIIAQSFFQLTKSTKLGTSVSRYEIRLVTYTMYVCMKVGRTTYLRGQADVGEYLSQCPHHLLSPL